jgi:class 3 adenylate cyclase/pSer/pThr/pTyr-binding forkhead associated (FHA) protein
MSKEELAKLQELIKKRAELDEELTKFQRLVTVMFTDIVGSTSYFERYGDVSGLVYVHKCIDMLSPVAERHGGTICKTIGDALMTYFEDPVAAVRAAVEMQRALDAHNRTQLEPDKIRVRIGLNHGPGLIKDKDVFGDVVNAAARIESLAKGEQIFISHELEEKIRAENIPCQKVSEVAVKGKQQKITIYEVNWRGAKGEAAAAPAPAPAPTVAARVPVAKAAEQPAGATVVMTMSPMAAVAARPQKLFSLVVVRPDGSHGQATTLDKQVTVLGRVEGDIRFPDDPLVSRRHARFTITDQGVEVEDLNSANGIFRRLRSPHELTDGDIVLMGRQMFRFVPTPPGKEEKPKPDAKPEAKKGEAPPPAVLVRMLAGGVEENRYPLQTGENILGRTRGTINFPEDAYLSSRHARIQIQDSRYTLEDLQAANGTFVGVRGRVPLTDGDIILIGHQLLRVTALS